jgi:hypothetical protein
VVAVAGPIDVGDVELEDPSLDSLTLVSFAGALVTGRRVMAHVLVTPPGAGNVVFAQRTEVLGTIVAPRFPRTSGISRDEMAGCRIGPSVASLDPYIVGFDTRPALIDHRPEGMD